MTTQQLILSLVLATMVFSVALELRVSDFRRVAQTPRAVVCGLIPQFILLPVGTWLATLVLDLPANVEAAMILVAACPGGSLSNVITHMGRGNTALSVTMTAFSTMGAMFFTPFNTALWGGLNPHTNAILREIAISPLEVLGTIMVLLAIPAVLGMTAAHRYPTFASRARRPPTPPRRSVKGSGSAIPRPQRRSTRPRPPA